MLNRYFIVPKKCNRETDQVWRLEREFFTVTRYGL